MKSVEELLTQLEQLTPRLERMTGNATGDILAALHQAVTHLLRQQSPADPLDHEPVHDLQPAPEAATPEEAPDGKKA